MKTRYYVWLILGLILLIFSYTLFAFYSNGEGDEENHRIDPADISEDAPSEIHRSKGIKYNELGTDYIEKINKASQNNV